MDDDAIISVAQLKRVSIAPKTNGPTYTVVFRTGVEQASSLAHLAEHGDAGMQVDWRPEESEVWYTLSGSARLSSSRIAPDPDGIWQFDLALLLPGSDIIASIAVVAGAMAANELLGTLRLTAMQTTLDLATAAE